MEISGKVVFITGAAQGLGKAYAEALLERGAKVAFGDINAALGTATLQEFRKRFGEENVTFSAFDVTDHQQFRDAFDSAVSTFGHIDVLVNNAGILDESKWELMIAINFISMVFGTRLAIEHMRKDKGGRGGRIINISSRAALRNTYFIPVYSGTKHAVRSFTSSLALQPNIEELRIEFASLSPGAAATELMLSLDDERVDFFDDFHKRSENLNNEDTNNRLHDLLPGIFRCISSARRCGDLEVTSSNPCRLSTVVEAFMELIQLEKMNGVILLISAEQGKAYVKMESVVCT